MVMAGPPPGQQQRLCVKCGRAIAWDVNVCPYCGHDYRAQMAGTAQYGPQTYQPPATPPPYGAPPYQPQAGPPQYGAPQYQPPGEGVSGGMKILLYLLSFFIPIVGFIIGAIYYTKPATKEVGKMCIILGVLSIVLSVVCYIVFFILLAST